MTRLLGYAVDAGLSTGAFMLALAATSYAASLVTGHPIAWSRSNDLVALVFTCWQFLYYAGSWAANGRTCGMALLGLHVVRRDGRDVAARQAIVRTLAFPLSFLLGGAGFAGILLGRERRALHDPIAGTAVVYARGGRAASH